MSFTIAVLPAEARQSAKRSNDSHSSNNKKLTHSGHALPTGPAIHGNKEERTKAYLNAMQNHKNTPHDAVREEQGCRLARDKLWIGQAQQSIQNLCGLAELK